MKLPSRPFSPACFNVVCVLVLLINKLRQDVLLYLLERGADPNASDATGSTPAHIAVAGANIEVE